MKDVSIRKPMMSTMPNDSSRTVMNVSMPLRAGLRLHAPELVERALHLREDRGRAEDECTDAEDRGHEARLLQPRAPHGFLHGRRGLGADEIRDRGGNLPARGVLPEHDADDRDHDDHERCERKQRAEAQGPRVLEGVALEPTLAQRS